MDVTAHRRKGFRIFFCAANRSSDRTLIFLVLARFFVLNSADDESLASPPPEPFGKPDRLHFQTVCPRVHVVPRCPPNQGPSLFSKGRAKACPPAPENTAINSAAGRSIPRQMLSASRPPVSNHTERRKRTALHPLGRLALSHSWTTPRHAHSAVQRTNCLLPPTPIKTNPSAIAKPSTFDDPPMDSRTNSCVRWSQM